MRYCVTFCIFGRIEPDSEGFYVQAHFTLSSLYNKMQARRYGSSRLGMVPGIAWLQLRGSKREDLSPLWVCRTADGIDSETLLKAIRLNERLIEYVATHKLDEYRYYHQRSR